MSAEDVRIWVRQTGSLGAEAIDGAVAVLSADERAQYQRFHFARDARDYAAAHALLRHALSRDGHRAPADWIFDKTPLGKPFLRNPLDAAPAFSLSHTRGLVACAVTHGADVGVDVEGIDRDVDSADIASRFFSPQEAAHLMALDDETRRGRFFELWTLKEALVKALGIGMGASLHHLAFTVSAAGIRLEAPPEIDPGAWEFGLNTPEPRYRLAVAVRRHGSRRPQLVFETIAPQS